VKTAMEIAVGTVVETAAETAVAAAEGAEAAETDYPGGESSLSFPARKKR